METTDNRMTEHVPSKPSRENTLELTKSVRTETIKDALKSVNLGQLGEKDGQIQRRYDAMAEIRQEYLHEARRMSMASIPHLFPPEGTTDLTKLASPNQSLIARGVINISKSLSSTILPPNGRFFRHKTVPSVSMQMEQLKAQAKAQGAAEEETLDMITSAVDNKLVARDERIREFIKASPDPETAYLGMVFAVMSGGACIFKPNLDSSKVYSIEDHVTSYDSTGEVTEVIVRDIIHISKFDPKALRELFGEDDPATYEAAGWTDLPVYTRQVRRFDHWEIQVEIAGKRFSRMEGKEELDSPPFIAFPFFLYPKKHYGIGWLTHNKGDIYQFENTNTTMNQMIQVASQILAVIPPDMGLTKVELEKGRPGLHVVFGEPAKVSMIMAEISRNMGAIGDLYQTMRQTILSMFLMNEAVVRQAERVTQEEIRTVIAGLKELLGGLYISLARRVQRPYLNRIVTLMERAGELEPIDKSLVNTILTAGVETLEAMEEQQNLDGWLARLTQGGDQALARVNFTEYATRTANNQSVNLDNLIKTDEDLQREAGVQEIIQMASQLGPQGPQILSQAVQMIMQQMQQQQSGPPQDAGGGPPEPPTA